MVDDDNENNNGIRVMIVDDEKIVSLQICKFLSKEGYDVVGRASDGIEAFDKAKELRPALILMDIVMPHVHGLDAVKNIMDELPDTKIIVVTGLQQESIRQSAMEAGAKDCMYKPFRNSDLLEKIKHVIG
jgi:two-component system chemotaxis response regulator CheY